MRKDLRLVNRLIRVIDLFVPRLMRNQMDTVDTVCPEKRSQKHIDHTRVRDVNIDLSTFTSVIG